MKLQTLARKAAALPQDFDFQWQGPEQYSDFNFQKAVTTLPEAIAYIDQLRGRMGEYAMALHTLQEAYKKMRDLLLEFDVSRS